TMSIAALLLSLATTAAAAAAHGPFTPDFVGFMERNSEYNEYALSSFKSNGPSGTFGGRSTVNEKISHDPVLFIHGSGDSALNYSKLATGWTRSLDHFRDAGYKSGELYGLTYGQRDINYALNSKINCSDLLGLRHFIETILEYTEAEKIDIVAHGEMGVTLARMVAKGGPVHLSHESCDLGKPLTEKIDALVAISGANYGLCMCLMAGITHFPSCGQEGFAPGHCGQQDASYGACMDDMTDQCDTDDYACVLQRVNAQDVKEAGFVASLWSNADEVLGRNNMVWGRRTSLVPGSDFTHAYEGYRHAETKDETVAAQLSLVTDHTLNGGRASRHQ
ncbi:hypothetical protein PENTCL1PPCAC_27986, partial [Pristionchus entomophagus]